jgi:8-oxo-dGTP pyrophosphatase MutT (NUDIX family)
LAAVLAPLIESPEPALVFTVRASGLSRHAGEVSFPGGLQDPGEALVETALREAFEEIGLVGRDVDVLGALPPVHTSVSGILVIPFVGILEAPPAFNVSDDEIAEVLTVSVTRLAGVEREVEYRFEDRGTWRGWAYDVEPHTVWGATGRMLHSLLEAIRKETTWLSRER